MIFGDFSGFGGFWWCSECCVSRDQQGRPPGPPRDLWARFPFVWKSKIDIFGQIQRKSEVTTNVQALNTAKAKEGQIRSKSHYENFEN